MDVMTNEIKTNEHLQKIFRSESFEFSPKDKDLLKFLIDASLKGIHLKEYTVGREIFGNTFDPVKNETRVKMQLYNLRKKLEEYYKEEGKYDSLKLEFESGGYNIELVENKTINPPLIDNNTKTLGLLTFILLTVITVGYIYMLTSEEFLRYDRGGKFWIAFFHSDKKCHIYYGDKNNGQDTELSTDSLLNNEPYVSKVGPLSTFYLLQWFMQNNSVFEPKFASQVDWEDAKKNNVFFVGTFENLGSFDKIFSKYSDNFFFKEQQIGYTNKETGGTFVFNSLDEDSTSVDYTIVSRLPGPNNSVFSYFVSTRDMGCISMIQYFTENDFLNNFYDSMDEDVMFFVALYKISHNKKEKLGYQLLEFEPIKQEIDEVFWDSL